MLNIFRAIFGMLIFSNIITPNKLKASALDAAESQVAEQLADRLNSEARQAHIHVSPPRGINATLNPTEFDASEVYEDDETTDLCGNW